MIDIGDNKSIYFDNYTGSLKKSGIFLNKNGQNNYTLSILGKNGEGI